MFLLGIKALFFFFMVGLVIWGFWRFAHHTILTDQKRQEITDAEIKVKEVLKAASKIKEVPDSKIDKAKDKIKRTIKKGQV